MSRLYPFAALLIFIVAALHLAVSFINGFTGDSLIHNAAFVIYCVLAWLVYTRSRLTAWLSFFLMLFGGIIAMSATLATMPTPSPLHAGLWGVSWLAALCLFIILWKDDKAASAPKAKPQPQPQKSARQVPEINDKPAQKPKPQQPQQNARQTPTIT